MKNGVQEKGVCVEKKRISISALVVQHPNLAFNFYIFSLVMEEITKDTQSEVSHDACYLQII